MVKFSKELEAQLIPEWKDAFADYWQLKKHVKKIKLSRARNSHLHSPTDFGPCSDFFPISFIYATIAQSSGIKYSGHRFDFPFNRKPIEDGEELYQTELSQLFSEEDEVKVFFERLDEEVNKVNEFYEGRERELVERGDVLSKQLQILDQLRWNIPPSRSTAGIDFPRLGVDGTEMKENSNDTDEDDALTVLERSGIEFSDSSPASKMVKRGKLSKMETTMATAPTRTISTVTFLLMEELMNNPKKEGADSITKKKILCAEKIIRGAFVELYRGLGLLKTYSSLNMVAFAKILKKFDKVSSQQASTDYLSVVKRCHFITSDKVVRLMDEVESIFTKHFTSNDRKKAMKYLRPQKHKDSHLLTFFVGLFTGCFVCLFSIYAILAYLSSIFSATTEGAYMETIYPVFSIFALLSLHLFMYGCNLFMWKASRINHNFIFEFQPNTALKHRDAFLVCTTAMTAVVGAMVLHLLLIARGFSPSQIDAIPAILLVIFMTMLFCPFNIFYRSTRYCFIGVIRNIVCSPFCKVLMVDFFMADQLTSQIPMLRHLESTACNLLARSFRSHNHQICKSDQFYRELAYIISFLPYYWRAMQCARRWFDESDQTHLANMGKYVSAMVAAGARISFSRQPNRISLALVVLTSFGATVYQLYWDFVKDWGLLNPNSINPWLRDDLVLKNKTIYYLSMVTNVVLRVAWVETVLPLRVRDVESRLLEFLLASLEVIRRGHWNFYRLENEHLNNVGKFRAVKIHDLPFRETEAV